MRYRSLILVVVASCGLHAARAQAQIPPEEQWGCFFPPIPSEYHYLLLQSGLSTAEGGIAPIGAFTYMLGDRTNENALSVGYELQPGRYDYRQAIFINYTRLFVESIAMVGPYLSGGIGISKGSQQDRTPEVRIGAGYVQPVSERVVLGISISERFEVSGLSSIGKQNSFRAGISLAYKWIETYWRD